MHIQVEMQSPGESNPLKRLGLLLSPNLSEHNRKSRDEMLLSSGSHSGVPRSAASESQENLFKMQILGPQSNPLDPKF